MSKRSDDDAADMEAGMTTAERRRRRRRGAGLRVPSDNVPRRDTSQVATPVPEDPNLAVSIAYSFGSDASGPASPADISAPEAVPTVVDASDDDDGDPFETRTREMSAVDLRALGLVDPSEGSDGRAARVSAPAPTVAAPPSDPAIDPAAFDREDDPSIQIDVDENTPRPGPPPAPPPAVVPVAVAAGGKAARVTRAGTVALSEDDLEELAEGSSGRVRAASAGSETMPLRETDLDVVARTGEAGPSEGRSERVSTPPPMPGTTKAPAPASSPAPGAAAMSAAPPAVHAAVPPPVPATSAPPSPPSAASSTPPPPPSAAAPPPPPPVAAAPPPPPVVHPAVPPAAPLASTAAAAAPPPPPPTTARPAPPPAPVVAGKRPTVTTSPALEALANDPARRNRRGKAWFEEIFDENYLRTLPFLTPQATQDEAQFVVEALAVQPGAQLLDLGCGYGRHSMELAARGYQVVGLDLSLPLLLRGADEAQRRGLSINFVHGDMRELDFESQFDGVFCVFSTFGYFDEETNKKTAANMARALKPGARAVIEILNRDYVVPELPTRVWWEGDGCVVLEEVEFNYFSSRIQSNRSIVFDDGRQIEQEISLRAYSLHELGKLLHAAGFRVVEVSGSVHTRGRFFGPQSRHIIVVAEKRPDAGKA
ncbi:MAG: methyltransferase domain-containing protein [Kofleriaceae bacterium]|nr:methyltransferase domain-containing protein [Kofleriaceae bacterium]MBP9202581.1 methyltransferase domain-containing protein [Kofleriaceae bacterium]